MINRRGSPSPSASHQSRQSPRSTVGIVAVTSATASVDETTHHRGASSRSSADQSSEARRVVASFLAASGELLLRVGRKKRPVNARAASPWAAAGRARTGGASPSKRSISTSTCWPVEPCARRDDPAVGGEHVRVAVRAQRVADRVGSTGSNHAPVERLTTCGRTSSVTTAPARHAPRSLNTRTTSPSAMPRAAASSGWMRIGSRPATFDAWLCRPRRAGRAAASPAGSR